MKFPGQNLLDSQRDAVLLVARLLIVVLFVWAGWGKLTGFTGTAGYMLHLGLPLPHLAAVIVVIAELGFGVLIALGLFTRPTALLLAAYTLATAFIGHPYWSVPEPEVMANMINFYKNISIVGGLLLLMVTGAGRYAIEGRRSVPAMAQ